MYVLSRTSDLPDPSKIKIRHCPSQITINKHKSNKMCKLFLAMGKELKKSRLGRKVRSKLKKKNIMEITVQVYFNKRLNLKVVANCFSVRIFSHVLYEMIP